MKIMAYQLKKSVEGFQVVDGPFAGRKFEKGKEYAEIPLEEAKKFEPVSPAMPAEKESKRRSRAV